MASIKDLVDNPHPIYKQYVDYWRFLMESYEGGIDYNMGDIRQSSANKQSNTLNVKVNGKPLQDKQRGNLFKHKKERDADYIERVNMSYYYNFCSPIIDIYTNHLFKEPVTSDFGSIKTIIESRMDNIDRKNSNIVEFRKEIAELAQIYGHIYVLTDKPTTDKEVASLAQQMEAGLFPYFAIFHPQDVINWALDQFGQPHWVLLREHLNANTDPFNFSKDNMNVVQYRLWTRTEWVLFNEAFEEVSRGTHPVGKVPIDIIYNKPSKKCKNYLGISEIADISFIARDVYNKCSELNEIIRNQTFSILCLQGKSTDYDELSVGTSKALLYPPESNVPQYVSPAADNARILMEQIGIQVSKMFQLAKLDGGSASQEKQIDSQSGVSKAFDFQETNSALAKKASHLEDGEMRIFDTFAKWEGKSEFDGSVSYPRNFSIQELNEDLEEAKGLFEMNLGREFNLRIKKEIAKKKFPRATDDDMNEIVKELEAKEGATEGGSLRERLPSFFNKDANQGGKNGGGNNVGRTTKTGS